MYEPAILLNKKEDSSKYRYFYDKPAILPKYLNHFVPPDDSIKIVNGPEICQCVGIAGVNQPH